MWLTFKRIKKVHFKLSELKVNILPLSSPTRKLNAVSQAVLYGKVVTEKFVIEKVNKNSV